MHLKVDAILFQNIFQQRPGQRHFEWLDASWCFSLFPIWSSRDLFYDMLCVFTQLHKPAHIVESLEMHATKNVFAKVRFYGIMVYHLVMTHIAMERSTIFKFGKPSIKLAIYTMAMLVITRGYHMTGISPEHITCSSHFRSTTVIFAPQWDHDFSSPNSFHPRLDIMNPESNINYIYCNTSTTYNRWRSRSQSHIKSKGWLLDFTL